MIKKILFPSLLLVVPFIGVMAGGLSIKRTPVLSGEIVNGTERSGPSHAPGSMSSGIASGSRVKISEGFIIVINLQGERLVYPHG